MIVDLSCDIFLEELSVDQWDLLTILKVIKPWEFCDLTLWLCGQIGSGWCGKEHLGENFPTHQKTSDFVKRIKSYDHLKLLVCIRVFGLCSIVFQ
jgi:hypothetical protein